MRPDFGLTAQDYARHRAGFPDSLFDRLSAFGIGERGQSVVDLGTGTGTLARGFAVAYTPADWRGRIRASAGVGASLPRYKVLEFDQALAHLLATRFPGVTLAIPHRVFAVIARAPAAVPQVRRP